MFAGVDFTRTSQAGIFGVSMDDVVIPEVGFPTNSIIFTCRIIMTTIKEYLGSTIGDAWCLEVRLSIMCQLLMASGSLSIGR